MVRISKQNQRRATSHRRTRMPAAKTGAKQENIPGGFKEQVNALTGDIAKTAYIPKI